jgi:prepilin-type N-terminal cleavage/methylation domain-containing protein
MKSTFFRKKLNAGFTLVEMLVVIFIFVTISVLTIFQFAANRRNATLDTTTEEIALSLRKAQSLALAVKAAGSGFTTTYKNGYGVHFSLMPGGSPQDAGFDSYVLFTDYEANPGPGLWDRAYLTNGGPCIGPSQPTHECLEKFTIESGDRITAIETCTMSLGLPTCSTLSPGSSLDITFLRPNLDAFFCTIPAISSGCRGLAPSFASAKITVTSPLGVSKKVVVWSTGQISIE